MPNAQLAANEPAYHAVSVWRHFCTARFGTIGTRMATKLISFWSEGEGWGVRGLMGSGGWGRDL
jgi:hypothetical protein